MDGQQQPTGSLAPASNHTACSITPGRGRQPALGGLRLLADAGAPRSLIEPADIDRAAGSRPPLPRPAAPPPGSTAPPCAVRSAAAATHRDDRAAPAAPRSDDPRRRPAGTCSSIAWLKRSIGPPRSASQRMIGVGGNRAGRDVGQRGGRLRQQPARRRPAPRRSDAGTPRAGVITSPALRARLTSWIDMMLSPPSAKKLSSMPTRSSPSTSANSAAQHLLLRRARRPPQSRSARGPAPAAPRGRACRWASAAACPAPRRPTAPCSPASCCAEMRPQRRRIDSLRPQPPPHRPPAACRPALSSRAITAACATPAWRSQRRLDLARLDAEAAHLHLRVGPPEELQHPVRAPARQVAGAVHPAPGRPERVGHEPLRRQPRPPQIAARQPRARDVQLARNPRRHRLQAIVQHVNLRVRRSDARSERRVARISVMQLDRRGAECVVSVGP